MATTTAKDAVAWLERQGTKKTRDSLVRYGIVAPRSFGVTVGTMLAYAKKLGKDHDLSLALWKTGWYEARMLAAMVGEPKRVTRAQMNAWAGEFDNWGVCDSVCWHLFDYTPFAWEKARQWSASPREYVKRAGFVLMAGQAARDKASPDARFVALFPPIEKGARDERNFVKKAVNWALRRIGRRNLALNEGAIAVARRLAASNEPSCRWVGKDALRELTGPTVRKALARTR
jgi:3-methyladenine DNA glycosylase AlkD